MATTRATSHEAVHSRRVDDRRPPETQERLDFCAEHGIAADIERVRAEQIKASYERVLKGDVEYCFVIDNATLVG